MFIQDADILTAVANMLRQRGGIRASAVTLLDLHSGRRLGADGCVTDSEFGQAGRTEEHDAVEHRRGVAAAERGAEPTAGRLHDRTEPDGYQSVLAKRSGRRSLRWLLRP